MGIQLHEINFKMKSLLNTTVNLTFVITIFYGLCKMDPYNIEAGTKWLEDHFKPLVGLIIKSDAIYVHPLAYALNIIYFTMFGRKIVQLLDSDEFGQVYQAMIGGKSTFCILLMLYTLAFIMQRYNHIVMIPEEGQGIGWKVASIMCMFVLHQHQYMILGVLHYAKFSTNQSLELELKQLQSTSTNIGMYL